MRSILLVLKIVFAISFAMQSIESLAMPAKAKTINKKSVKKTLSDTGDVWDRIRSGMQIPRSFPNQTMLIPAQSLSANTANIAQKNALIKTTVLSAPTPTLHHDDDKRPRLHSVIGGGRPRLSADELEKQKAIIDAVSSNGRIKTKLRAGNTLVAQNNDSIVNGSGNKNKAKLNLAKEELKKQIDEYVNANSDVATARLRTRIEPPRKTDIVDKVATTDTSVKTVAMTSTEPKLSKNKTEPAVQMIKVNSANERIGKHIAWYSQHPAYLQQVAERARPYLYHIVSQLSANHLPPELALLPIVESAYQPTAESPKSAAGLWQFIPSTGLDFDLAQSEHYDERLDIEASTQAAIRYLSILRRHYGDWLLALAAYNCGEGRVDNAIEQNRANGLPTDYWSLGLPEETREYVPRFLALASIFANPKGFGLKLPAIKNEPYFVKVKVDRRFAIDYLANKNLAAIAEMANLDYEQFVRLNPGYLKSTIVARGPFSLLLPASNAEQFNQHLNHVARFLAEPTVVASNAPLKKRVQTDENQKTLPVAVVRAIHETPKLNSPLLSLNVSKQTTPRINTQPILSDFSVQLAPSV